MLGLGLGLGISLHVVLDLLLWFNSVELLWPFGGWVNFREKSGSPSWLKSLQDPAEFLFFAFFFFWLFKAAQQHKTDTNFLGALRWWIIAMGLFWIVFTILTFATQAGIISTIYGALYLVSLTAAFVIVIGMRNTVEA